MELILGVTAATTMVLAYALEPQSRIWIAVFAGGCIAAALYGALTEAWVFAGLEIVWAAIAIHRFRHRAPQRTSRYDELTGAR